MNPQAYLVCDPARVITDPAAWQAFKDIFGSGLEDGTEWQSPFGKVAVSHASSCGKGTKNSGGYFVTSDSGYLALLYRRDGWTEAQARELRGFPSSSRTWAGRTLYAISERL